MVGLDGWRAARMLADDGLSVGSVVEQESGERVGTVLRTNPSAGTAVRPGSPVGLVVAKRRAVEVPNVAGFDRWRAARALADDGLSVGSVMEEESDKKAGTVLRTTPSVGTTVRSGSPVGLVIAKAAAKKDPAEKDPAPKDLERKDSEQKDLEPTDPSPTKVSGPDAREPTSPGVGTDPATN
ncbi:MAG: PASTA domain-containing protein [Pseudonocardiaceae bacterium]